MLRLFRPLFPAIPPAVMVPGSGAAIAAPEADVDGIASRGGVAVLDGLVNAIKDVGQAEAEDAPGIVLSEKGVRFERIPLRDFIRTDPRMQDLNPFLKMRPLPKDPQDYTMFRTVLTDAGLDPKDAKFQEIASRAEKAYARYIDNTRIFVSYPDQIPGFRRFVLLGPGFSSGRMQTFIAVKEDGRLISGTLAPDDRETEPLRSVAEALEVVLNGHEDWHVEEMNLDFDLNRHSRSFRSCAESMLESVRLPLEKAPRKARYKIMHTLRGKAEKRLNLARWAICDALDPEVLRTMRGTGMTKVDFGTWLTGGDFEAPNPEIALARLQAIRAYPILAHQMYTSAESRETIDARKPLAPVIAKQFGTEEKTVKRLQGLTWQRAATSPRYTGRAVRELLRLPEHCLPSTRPEFRHLRVIVGFAQFLYREDLGKTLERLSEGGSPWRLMDRMRETSGFDVRDAVEFLAEKLFVPATLNKLRKVAEEKGMQWDHEKSSPEKLKQKAVKQILDMLKPKELLDLSDRYHRNIARYEDRLSTISRNDAWSPFLGEIELEGGIRAIELTSGPKLKAQGRAQNHCVGGYVSRILIGSRAYGHKATLIFSLEKDGEILSTAEIRCWESTRDFVDPETGEEKTVPCLKADVHQNQAYGNSAPSDEAKQAVKHIIGRIEAMGPDAIENFMTYEANLADIRARRERDKMANSYIRMCGYNPWQRDVLERSWEELQATLPRKVRKKGLEAFIDQMPITGQNLSVTLGMEVENLWDYVDKVADLVHEEPPEVAEAECDAVENIPF